MTTMTIKSAEDCKWDILSLGEVMIRLDPGDNRVARTRHFQVWEGGGEYNVARGLRRCFGQRADGHRHSGKSGWTTLRRFAVTGRCGPFACQMGALRRHRP